MMLTFGHPPQSPTPTTFAGTYADLKKRLWERSSLLPTVALGTKLWSDFSALAPTKDAVARIPVNDASEVAIVKRVSSNLHRTRQAGMQAANLWVGPSLFDLSVRVYCIVSGSVRHPLI
jgi:hypothetical protein